MFCTKCGEKLADNGKFCQKCGAPVKLQVAPTNVTEAVQPNIPSIAQPIPQSVDSDALMSQPDVEQATPIEPQSEPEIAIAAEAVSEPEFQGTPKDQFQPEFQATPEDVSQPEFQAAPQLVSQPEYQAAPGANSYPEFQAAPEFATPPVFQSAPPMGPAPFVKKNNKKKFFILGGAIAVLVLIIVAGSFIFIMDRNKKIKSFEEAVLIYEETLNQTNLGVRASYYEDLLEECQDSIDEKELSRFSELEEEMTTALSDIAQIDIDLKELVIAKVKYANFLDNYRLSESDAEEFNQFKADLDNAISSIDISSGQSTLSKLTTLADKIMEDNELIAGYLTSYKAFPVNFNEYIMSDYESSNYSTYIEQLNTALNRLDLVACNTLVASLDTLETSVLANSIDQTSTLYSELEYASVSDAFASETTMLKGFSDEVSTLLASNKYASAMTIMNKWSLLLDAINGNGYYNLEVNQVDVSEYPIVKLYVKIEDLISGTSLDTLITENFYLAEKKDGTSDFVQVAIDKAVQLDQEENLNINIVADVSGSMVGSPLDTAKYVMNTFVNSIQFDIGDKASLITFADDVNSKIAFTSDSFLLSDAINTMQTGNMTSLYDALYVAINQTAQQSGAKCVIAFTDGDDNDSDCTPQIIAELAKRYNIPVYIIGVGTSIDPSALEMIADSSNGFYRSIYDIGSMEDIYNTIYRQQKQLYLLEYFTSQTEDVMKESNLYLNYLADDIAARKEFAFTPAVLMEVSTSFAQLRYMDFIIYDSDSRYITAADLQLLTVEELRLARNEIYARRGRKFKDTELQAYFDSKSWYNGTIKPDSFKESMFNDYEKANAYFIKDYENLNGFN